MYLALMAIVKLEYLLTLLEKSGKQRYMRILELALGLLTETKKSNLNRTEKGGLIGFGHI